MANKNKWVLSSDDFIGMLKKIAEGQRPLMRGFLLSKDMVQIIKALIDLNSEFDYNYFHNDVLSHEYVGNPNRLNIDNEIA